jgi:hypothetical protein
VIGDIPVSNLDRETDLMNVHAKWHETNHAHECDHKNINNGKWGVS